MPAHVIYGDTFLVSAALRRLKEDAGAGDLMDSNRHRLTAGSAQPDEALSICNSLPFLDPVRLVELEGALATQEPAGAGDRRGGSGGGAVAAAAEAAAAAAPAGGNPPAATAGPGWPTPSPSCPTAPC